MWEAIGELISSAAKAGLEYGIADAARRAQLRAEIEAAYHALFVFWQDFEARADDRARDAMSDADDKPPRPAEHEDTKP